MISKHILMITDIIIPSLLPNSNKVTELTSVYGTILYMNGISGGFTLLPNLTLKQVEDKTLEYILGSSFFEL